VTSTIRLAGALRHLGVGAIVEKVSSFVSGLILLRLLGLAEYGSLVLLYSTYALLDFAIGLGLGDLVVASCSAVQREGRGLYRSYLVWLAASMLLIGAAAVVAEPLLTATVPSIEKVFWLAVAAGLSTSVRNVVITGFRIDGKFAGVKHVDITRSVALATGYLVLIGGFRMGLTGGLLAYLIANLLPLCFVGRQLFADLSRGLTRKAFAPVIALILEQGKWQLARYGVTAAHGAARPWLIQITLGIEAVALFNAAKTILGIPADLLPIKEALIPLMSRESSDPVRLRQLYIGSLRYSTVALASVALALVVATPVVFSVLFPQYVSAVALVQVMAVSLVVSGIATPQASMFYALRLQRSYLSTTAWSFIFMLATGVPLMLWWGLIGMGISFVLNAAFVSWLRQRELCRSMPSLSIGVGDCFSIQPSDREFLRHLLLGK
jgi:O-antigen/teichoic acid export membrane protein